MSKVTYETKMKFLDGVEVNVPGSTEVVQAIKLDVVKASSKAGKVDSEQRSKHSGTAPKRTDAPPHRTQDSIYIEGTDGAATPNQDSNQGTVKPDNTLYNACMGVYREFLKGRNSHLDMTGIKAKWNSEAMRGIIKFMQDFARSNGMPYADENILAGMKFLFTQENWNRLNDFHRNRIKLPDIHKYIEEILPMIRNGHDKKSAEKTNLQSFKQRLKNG